MAKVQRKTVCPITRTQFREKAQPIELTINGKSVRVPVKEFSTGSLGWYYNDKMAITIDGQDVMVQLGLNFTIVGSKELPQDQPATELATEATDAAATGIRESPPA